jgi:hypothetical protein
MNTSSLNMNNPYALPKQQYIVVGKEKVPVQQYYDQHIRQTYEMLPFSQHDIKNQFSLQEKINMTKSIVDISKGEYSDNMFLCGMDMASKGEAMLTQAKQRISWDELHDIKHELSSQEYETLRTLIEKGDINKYNNLMKTYKAPHAK